MGCPLQPVGFPWSRQQTPIHLNACSSLSRLFLNGWRTVRDDIQVKYSPCFAMPETWAFSKKQASSHWYSKVLPTPPHLTHSSTSDYSNGYSMAALEKPCCYVQLHLRRRDSHISGTVSESYANSDHADWRLAIDSSPVITGGVNR